MSTRPEPGAATDKVCAPSSRQALRLLRERLGPDAFIVSSRVTADGVEIIATLEESLARAPRRPMLVALPGAGQSAPAPVPAAEPAPGLTRASPPASAVAPIPAPAFASAPATTLASATAPAPALASAPAPLGAPQAPAFALAQGGDGGDDSVLREIHSMRGMIEERLAGLAWSEVQRRDPLRGQLLRTLLGAGFSARMARELLADLPTGQSYVSGLNYLKQVMAGRMRMLESEDALMNEGGVYALIGPTGVGKTTTTAKLAARCVMRFGPQKLALVTTDSYRIGAYEQLRIYGQILGVPVHAVKDATDLDLVLGDLRHKHMVLIDTVGMSQRDRAVSDQISMLCGASRPVKRLLLLNAASHGDTLNEVVHAYRHSNQSAKGSDLAGCILTKVDEATHPGALIDTVIRHQLPVHYISSGQKVPEHLMLGNADVLIDSVFEARSSSSLFVPGEADLDESSAALQQEARIAEAAALSERLRAQCQQLIRVLSHDAEELTANAAALGAAGIGFDQSRELWRQLADERIDAPAMHQALLARAGADGRAVCGDVVLACSSDIALGPQKNTGARLLVSALLSDRTGLPFAASQRPLARAETVELLLGSLALPDVDRPVVHLLPGLPAPQSMQVWQAAGLAWVASVSASLGVVLVDGDKATTLGKLPAALTFSVPEPAVFRGVAAWQSVAEVPVRLRPVAPEGSVEALGGAGVLRCVVRRVTDAATGKVLTHSYLLASAGQGAGAQQLAQWAVWRAAAEPYFKLVAQGMELLGQGEVVDPLADSKKAMVAAQVGMTVLGLQQAQAAWAEKARRVLAQLTGRATRPDRPVPGAALLEGLEKLFVLLDALQTDGVAASSQPDLASVPR